VLKSYLYNKFGSKRGLLNYSKYYIQQRFGMYMPLRRIQWERVQRLIFICQGNICRSPMGEAYAAHRGAVTESFGIDCAEGHPADPRAINYAASIGLDLSSHRTRNLRQLTPRQTDLLIVMEPAHLLAMREPAKIAQVTLAGLWLPKAHPYVHDPYCASQDYFQHCEDTVVKAVQGMLMNHRP